MKSKLIPKHQTPNQPLVLSQDNTRVDKPIESIPITETNLYKQYLADPYKNSDFNTWRKRQELIQSNKKDEKVKADKRATIVKKQESEQGKAIYNQQQRKEQEAKINKGIWTGIGLGSLALAQMTPAGPYIDGAFATHGALGLAEQADKGTLGWNGETALNVLQTLPFGIRGAIKGIMYGAGRYLPNTKFGNWSRAKIISNNMHDPKVTGINLPIQTTITAQTKPAININHATVDMGKMIDNNRFLDLVDDFAKKYGYPLTDRSVITSTRRTNKHARKILARHNTYARGVRPTTFEPNIKYITSQIGDNFTEEQALRFMATHPHKYSPEEISNLWFSPESNAFMYGGDSKTAAIRRMYKLSPNRNNWTSDADFIVESNPMYRNLSWEQIPETDIIDVWRSPKNIVTSGRTTELATTGNMHFAGWLNPKKFKHRMSLNTEWTPKNLTLINGKYIDLDLLP